MKSAKKTSRHVYQARNIGARVKILRCSVAMAALAKLSSDDGLPVAWIEGEWRRRAGL